MHAPGSHGPGRKHPTQRGPRCASCCGRAQDLIYTSLEESGEAPSPSLVAADLKSIEAEHAEKFDADFATKLGLTYVRASTLV